MTDNTTVKTYGTRHPDRKDGVEGFSPQYSGNAISGLSNTSSFDVQAGEPDMSTRSEGTGTDLHNQHGKPK